MKALILAGGYGTRLEKEIKDDRSGKYFSLSGVPKPLLPVGEVPLISRWMRQLEQAEVTDVTVVTNARYFDLFKKWSVDFKYVKLLNDGTRDCNGRLGAIGDMHLAICEFSVKDDLIVIGGDTLFFEDFNLMTVIEEFKSKTEHSDSIIGGLVLRYTCQDSETSKRGILELEESGRVTAFLEKPSPQATQARNACPCFYILSSRGQSLIDKFLAERRDSPLTERDAPGKFLSYLCQQLPVFAYKISGRFDVGGLSSYIECDRYFRGKRIF
jgi:NDP-sugar pyrophosphorylase family protein